MTPCPRACVTCEALGVSIRRYPGSEFEPSRERAAHAIRILVAKTGLHPYDVNDGRCDEFADDLVATLGDGEVFDLGEFGIPHYCVRYAGLFFDAEEPYGVRAWNQLPLCVRHRRGLRNSARLRRVQ